MARRAAVVLLALVLAATALAARLRLEGPGETRVPAGLLYLPKGPYLRALAVGQEETLADVLYIWAIQYYSNYDDKSRYGYVEAVFDGAITELDPQFSEAYLVGALIMTMEARQPDMALRLFDKGLARMPDNWELAYWAGWEAYSAGRFAKARDYWNAAAAIPGASPVLQRLSARMLEKQGDRDAAIAEYRHLLETTTDEHTKGIVRSWLERLLNDRALATTRDALFAYRDRFGRCPAQLEALVRAGLMRELPQNASGGPLSYDPATCDVLTAPGESFGNRK